MTREKKLWSPIKERNLRQRIGSYNDESIQELMITAYKCTFYPVAKDLAKDRILSV